MSPTEDMNEAGAGAIPQHPDLNLKRGLEITCDDEELLRTVIGAIIEECPILATQLREAAKNGQAEQIRINVHTLKGSLRTVAGDDLLELGNAIEKLASRDELQDIDPKVDEFLKRVDVIMPLLAHYADADSATD